MSQRKYRTQRCEGCGLHPPLCLCEHLPSVRVDSRIIVVQQIRERFKPTNTARLLPGTLGDVPIVTYGQREPPFDESAFLAEDTDYHVLYPCEDAALVTELEMPPGRRRAFVVLDGTWHQCSRMRRRVPRVREFSPVMLPEVPPSIWPARTQHDARGLSTFEAVARLIECLHGPDAAAPMLAFFERYASRIAYMKGFRRDYD